MTETVLRHHRELTAALRRALVALYAEVRAPLLHLPNYAVAAFVERLELHSGQPGFEAVLGYDGTEPVGYAYGNTVESGDRWWARLARATPPELTAAPTFALRELGVRARWRGTGAARRIHEGLTGGRGEGRVMLMVNPAAGGGKVLALYEAWGYQVVNEVPPTAEAPPLVAMARACRWPDGGAPGY
ncbi:GNAT family N-acetyltransferase [Kitasatospora sp. NBC_01246]|uniref:GNAT family N-acetyltransferase n=1 Tax=Kitasatospora sp. NBC_01246 TaxID=2903570 RepID=UPI002E314FEC|nr:GNAT family N-acetyltransferase [Kitasatospora sp. NBC_01246]